MTDYYKYIVVAKIHLFTLWLEKIKPNFYFFLNLHIKIVGYLIIKIYAVKL